MPADQMPASQPAEDVIEVWDVNWTVFGIFRACATQWRMAGLQTVLLFLGLDYQGVDVVMRRLLPQEADPAGIIADILVMEAEALPILNQEAEGAA